MLRKIIVVLLLLLSVGCEDPPRINPLADDALLLAFGDSLTYGTGAAKGQAYPAVLSKLIGRKVINAGVPGEISASGRDRLPIELAKHSPTLVILCHGGNDFLRRLDQGDTTENIRTMIETIQASGADVVLIGVPKLGFGLDVPAFYTELANEYEVPYEKDILVDLLSDSAMKSDTIHPNAAGYRRMAEATHKLIEKAQD